MDKITRTPVESSSTAAQIKSLRNNAIEWTNLNKNEHSCCTDKVLYVHHHTCSCIMHMCNLKYKCIHYKQNKWVKSTNLTKKPSEDWKGSLCLPLVVGTGHDSIHKQLDPTTYLRLLLHCQKIYWLSFFIQYIPALHLTFVPLSLGFALSSSSVAGWAGPGCGRCRSAGSWRPPGPALSWSRLPEAYWPPPAFAPPSRSASAPLLPVTDEWNKEHSFNKNYQYLYSCACHGYRCNCDVYCKTLSTHNCFFFVWSH